MLAQDHHCDWWWWGSSITGDRLRCYSTSPLLRSVIGPTFETNERGTNFALPPSEILGPVRAQEAGFIVWYSDYTPWQRRNRDPIALSMRRRSGRRGAHDGSNTSRSKPMAALPWLAGERPSLGRRR